MAEVNRASLLEALTAARPGVATKDVVEQSDCFAFHNNYLITYNDIISVQQPIGALNLQLEGAVKAIPLFNLLAKLTDDVVDLTVKDERQLIIRAGKKVKAGLAIDPEIKMPVSVIGQVKDWHKLPSVFMDGLELAMFVCTDETSQRLFTCVGIGTDKGKIETTDGVRAVVHDIDRIDDVKPFSIPYVTVKALVTYGMDRMGVTHVDGKGNSGWAHFMNNGGTIFSCRIYEGAFIDTSPAFEIEPKAEFDFPDGLGDLIERLSIFSEAKDMSHSGFTKVSIKGNELRMKTEGDDGWMMERIKLYGTKSATPIQFMVQLDFLKDLLDIGVGRHCLVDDDKVVMIGDGWKHVFALAEEGK